MAWGRLRGVRAHVDMDSRKSTSYFAATRVPLVAEARGRGVGAWLCVCVLRGQSVPPAAPQRAHEILIPGK